MSLFVSLVDNILAPFFIGKASLPEERPVSLDQEKEAPKKAWKELIICTAPAYATQLTKGKTSKNVYWARMARVTESGQSIETPLCITLSSEKEIWTKFFQYVKATRFENIKSYSEKISPQKTIPKMASNSFYIERDLYVKPVIQYSKNEKNPEDSIPNYVWSVLVFTGQEKNKYENLISPGYSASLRDALAEGKTFQEKYQMSLLVKKEKTLT